MKFYEIVLSPYGVPQSIEYDSSDPNEIEEALSREKVSLTTAHPRGGENETAHTDVDDNLGA